MNISRYAFSLFALLILTGCASQGFEARENVQEQTVSQTQDSQNIILENGYAQMYGAVSSLAWTDKVFLIRFETDQVEAFGKKLSKNAKDLKADLEYLAEKTPWLDLENTGMPEIENMKIAAVQKDRLKSLLPIIGRSQPNFERTLLLSNSGALNQMQHLTSVMLGIEHDKKRRAFLQKAYSVFSDLYEDDIELLNSAYFCHDTGAESKGFR